MATTNQITSPWWGISAGEIGQIVQGLAHIDQCIAIIMTTQKGTDPLRPDFGVDLTSYIDQPITQIPNLLREIRQQVAKYETRAKITSISYTTENTSTNRKIVVSLDWSYSNTVNSTTQTLNI